jgi:hypothetical protein
MDDFQDKIDALVREHLVPYLEEHMSDEADTLMIGVVAGVQDGDDYQRLFAALPFTDDSTEERRRRARELFEYAARQYS